MGWTKLALVFIIALLSVESSMGLSANNQVSTSSGKLVTDFTQLTPESSIQEERDNPDNGDGTVTVTKYNKNGLIQKFQGIVKNVVGQRRTRRLRAMD